MHTLNTVIALLKAGGPGSGRHPGLHMLLLERGWKHIRDERGGTALYRKHDKYYGSTDQRIRTEHSGTWAHVRGDDITYGKGTASLSRRLSHVKSASGLSDKNI